MMQNYARLPVTNTAVALDIKKFEEVSTADGAKRLMKENDDLKKSLDSQRRLTAKLRSDIEKSNQV